LNRQTQTKSWSWKFPKFFAFSGYFFGTPKYVFRVNFSLEISGFDAKQHELVLIDCLECFGTAIDAKTKINTSRNKTPRGVDEDFASFH
jgi:hypothetical protein